LSNTGSGAAVIALFWQEEVRTLLYRSPFMLVFHFLDAFAKLRKATIGFVMSARMSVSIEKLTSHWTDFHEIWYLSIFFFENTSRKFKFYYNREE